MWARERSEKQKATKSDNQTNQAPADKPQPTSPSLSVAAPKYEIKEEITQDTLLGKPQAPAQELPSVEKVSEPQTETASSAPLIHNRNKVGAGILAIFLGVFGAHKFYLGRPVQGLIWILLSFSWVLAVVLAGFGNTSPWVGAILILGLLLALLMAFISLIEGIVYLTQNKDEFNRKYNTK